MAAENNSRGLVGAFVAMDASNKLVSLLTLSLVVAVFFVGYFYGQVKLIGGGKQLGSSNAVAGGEAQAAPDQGQAPEEAPPLTQDQWEELLENPAAVRGNKDAKVVMVEFTDYQCPFCARHFTETEGVLSEKYIDAGKVLHVIRDLPLPFHPNASAAAQAARCAGDQGKYWEMHDQLFAKQDTWSTGDPVEVFGNLAADAGINRDQLVSCLESETYKAAVDADVALASQVGANGTPTFFINSQRVVGAQPIAAFETVIEQEL